MGFAFQNHSIGTRRNDEPPTLCIRNAAFIHAIRTALTHTQTLAVR
jgi:hypothetical protein